MRRPITPAIVVALAGLLAPLRAPAAEVPAHRTQADCTIDAGPNDRVSQDRDLVIPAGAVVDTAAALRGNLTVEAGARVRKAAAVGGSVTVRSGAVVLENAVALGGDVRVEAAGSVEGEAVALGGQVKLDPGARVKGSVTSLAFQVGGTGLAQAILRGLQAQGPCRVPGQETQR